MQVLSVFGNTLNGIFSLAQILWPDKMETMFGGFGGLIFFLKMLLLIWTEWGAKQGRALVINGKRQ